MRPVLLLILVLLPLASGCMKAKLVNPSNLAQPKIMKVIPSIAASEKPTEIAIIGTGFVNGAEVRLGQMGCENIQYVSESTVYCTAPAQPPSRVSVRVVNPNAKVFELPDAFAYIDSLVPVSGFAISGGGGVSRSTGRMMTSTIGEVGRPVLLKSQGRSLIVGSEALHFDDSN